MYIENTFILYKAAWSDLFALTVLNNSHFKPIILESYRCSPINTNRIRHLSKLIPYGHKENQTKLHHVNV